MLFGSIADTTEITDRLQYARLGIFGIFLEFETNLAFITGLPQYFQNRTVVDHTAAHLPRLALFGGSGFILEMDVVNPFLVFLQYLGIILSVTHRVAQIEADTDPLVRVFHPVDHLLGVGESLVIGTVRMDGHLDAGLFHLLFHIGQELVIGHADEHVDSVTFHVIERRVDLLLAFHINRAENISLDPVTGQFLLEGGHLLRRTREG